MGRSELFLTCIGTKKAKLGLRENLPKKWILKGEEVRNVSCRPCFSISMRVYIFKEALKYCIDVIVVNGSLINNIRYANDTALITPDGPQMQSLLERINKQSKRYGLKINIKKTKYLIVSKINPQIPSLIIENQQNLLNF